MSTLIQARADLLQALGALEGADVTLVNHVPEELPVPCVVIDAAEDYLTQAETYDDGEWWAGFTVYALVGIASNAQAIEDLEALLTALLPALAASDWEVSPIPKPGPFHTTTWLAHGVAITVRNLITL